jgi:hypothetical protein
MSTNARLLAIALLMGTAWTATPATAQRQVPGDPVALRAHRANTGLFGPRTRKVTANEGEGVAAPPVAQLFTADTTPSADTIKEAFVASAPAPEALRTLRAVLVVGPAEGNTRTYIAEMNDAAQVLREHGVQVSTFHHPYATWDDVARAAQGADIFIYSGHGVAHDRQAKVVGGLALSDGIVDPLPTAEGLALRKGAVVLFAHVCYTAGSAAGDRISLREAHRRVACYATPFLRYGADAYFAINLCDAMAVVLRRFLRGEPLDAAGFPIAPSARPLKAPGTDTAQVLVGSVENTPSANALDRGSYDVAFVGPRRYTIHQLLERP